MAVPAEEGRQRRRVLDRLLKEPSAATVWRTGFSYFAPAKSRDQQQVRRRSHHDREGPLQKHAGALFERMRATTTARPRSPRVEGPTSRRCSRPSGPKCSASISTTRVR